MPRRRLLTTNAASENNKISIDFFQIIVSNKKSGCNGGVCCTPLLRYESFLWTMRICDFINNKLLKLANLIKLGSLAFIILLAKLKSTLIKRAVAILLLRSIKLQKQYVFKSFSHFFFLLIVSQLILSSVLAVANKDAARLFEDLLADYNKLVRPVENNTATLVVKFKLKLSQLLDVVRD